MDWEKLQNNNGGVDPATLLNSRLANALSTMGDAQYWEDSIAPSEIRSELEKVDPSHPNSTSVLLRGMKWLLASISKGRNVSDFFPVVVKLVQFPHSLEARKMVYMYLVQYADHDSTTRELSLLSINSFQKGLADQEPFIRALALRVLTSIRIPDVIQIQILGVQKCASDQSPYVRKCAVNALMKLYGRCLDNENSIQLLKDILQKLLKQDTSTMVITSGIITFSEMCPQELDLLHGCYRKLCHMLCDMDEWGQVMVLDVLSKYCRTYFCAPRGLGSAEAIDAERRVTNHIKSANNILTEMKDASGISTRVSAATLPERPPGRQIIKRRVVKKGFYSDEEDDSTDEEVVYTEPANIPPASNKAKDADDLEDDHLDSDHRLLLHSSLPLLKSRNSAVVLGVCSLHYYCGVASIKVRTALGKALVRIHHGRRELQYSVLNAIRCLVGECPSAFAPFLQDFFVRPDVDPSFTRLIKLDILTELTLDPNSINAVLKELSAYIRSQTDRDVVFCCAAIRAVARVMDMARVVHDRHATNSGSDIQQARQAANRYALNALYGLHQLTYAACHSSEVVGEASVRMGNILQLLQSDTVVATVVDPDEIQDKCYKRILMLVLQTLLSRQQKQQNAEGEDDQEENSDDCIELNPSSFAASLWVITDWLTTSSATSPSDEMQLELARLLSQSFATSLDATEKMQAIHFAAKVLTLQQTSEKEMSLCEFLLSMGRIDSDVHVRDRARMESQLVQPFLQHDLDHLIINGSGNHSLAKSQVQSILNQRKPPSSFIVSSSPEKNKYPFGTLSSLVSHATPLFVPLPPWAMENSSPKLRDESVESQDDSKEKMTMENSNGFYNEEDDTTESSSSSESDSSSDDSTASDDNSSSSDDSSSYEDDSSSDEENLLIQDDNFQMPTVKQPAPQSNALLSFMDQPSVKGNIMPRTTTTKLSQNMNSITINSDSNDDDDDGSSSEDDDSDSEDDDSDDDKPATSNLLGLTPEPSQMNSKQESLVYGQGLEGLVMAPVVTSTTIEQDPDLDNDSSAWIDWIRPELAHGLHLKARYLRGPTRQKEAQMLRLEASNPALIMLQLYFRNEGTYNTTLRRVRLTIRKTRDSNSHIGVQKSCAPPEITTLSPGTMTHAMLGIVFNSVSDREGTLQAKLDIKTSRGNHTFDLRPPLVELVQPLPVNRLMSLETFMAEMKTKQGFQRVKTKLNMLGEALYSLILRNVALPPLKKGDKERLNMVGMLCQQKVYIAVDCSNGNCTVCCDNALAANSILDSIQKAVQHS